MHVFHSNSVRSNVILGVASLPAIALLCVAFGLGERGGAWIAAGLCAFAAAIGILLGAGWAARQWGVRVEVDDEGIRAIYRGDSKCIRWVDALTVSVEHGPSNKGTTLLELRVDDGRGVVIEATVPRMLGRALESGAGGALAILEREARVPLAVRESQLGQQGLVVRGTYASFPRTAWFTLALGGFVLVPAFWLLIVERFTGALAPCVTFFVGCASYAFLCWVWVGELELDERELRGGRRIGERWSIPRHEIARVEPFGSDELDSRGLTLVLRDGSRRKLARIAQRSMRDRLTALAPLR